MSLENLRTSLPLQLAEAPGRAVLVDPGYGMFLHVTCSTESHLIVLI